MEETLALMIPILGIVLGVGAVMLVFVLDYRKRRTLMELYHKERLAALERGMEIPPLDAGLLQNRREQEPQRYLLRGMIWLFVGLAILVALGDSAGEDVARLGLIPAAVGLAMLIYYFVVRRRSTNGRSSPADGGTAAGQGRERDA